MVRIFLLLLSPVVACAAPPAVTAVSYHPTLPIAAFGAGSEAWLIDTQRGNPLSVASLPGRITTMAFDPTGKWLAVASGTAGKNGELSVFGFQKQTTLASNPPITIPAHNDAINALAFSPDGTTLATAGYDRVIHLWRLPLKPTDQPVRTLKDHSDAVYSLSFHPKGELLASAGADRAVKVWQVGNGQRLYTLSDPTDWVYSVAWSPDGTHLAAAGVDLSIRIWAANAAGGKLIHSVYAHQKPIWRLAFSKDGQALYSAAEDRIIKVWDAGKMTETKLFSPQPDTILDLAVRPDGKQLALGRFDGVGVFLEPTTGKTVAQPIPIKSENKPLPSDQFPFVQEQPTSDSARMAQSISLPATVAGQIDRAGDMDYYRFSAKAGDEVGVFVNTTAVGSKLDPVVVVTDETGTVLHEGTTHLGIRIPRGGEYTIGIRDRDFRGGSEYAYRLNIGNLQVITGVFPLAVPRGRSSDVHIQGFNLGRPTGWVSTVTVPADAAIGSRLAIPIPPELKQAVGKAEVIVSEFPAVVVDPVQGADLRVPGSANGVLVRPNENQHVRFAARKGQQLVVEVLARRAGSPMDPVIEILDSAGQLVPRALLRATAKTYTTFRDHDSVGSGIRLEAWNELAIDDYLFANGELMKILALPKNPDDDCQFYHVGGQRVGYLGTTPTHHSQGSALYKVEIHPPGRNFPPNGLPMFPIVYRNDDGGPGFSKDAYLLFDPPADGTFQVRIRDAHGQGGANYAYQITVRPPRPDFTVSLNPTAPAVWEGGAIPMSARITRSDGFDGPVRLQLEGFPAGFHAPPTFIEAGQTSTWFALSAEPGTVVPPGTQLKLVASATIAGRGVVREVTGGTPKVIPRGDIVTRTNTQQLRLQPGSETRFLVEIERQGQFAGRVPIEVRGLPHGVRVLNIGLNGILITERETRREIVLFAEPWVQPMEHPIVIVALREGTGAQHAAPSVLLQIASEDQPTPDSPRLPRDNLLVYRGPDGKPHEVKTLTDWSRRRSEIVRGMETIMGRLPDADKRCELAVKIEEEKDMGTYVRRLLTYQSEPGSRVPAYLCIPKDLLKGNRKAPALLCLHSTDNTLGHGIVVGLGKNPNHNYAIELAERGYVTLAPSYPLLAKYQPDLKQLGWESGSLKAVWDNMRGLDYLQSLPFVNPDALGTIGHSLGGHNSVFTAVFDERLKVVVSSCGLDSFLNYYDGNARNWAAEKGWCQTRYMPKLSRYQGRLQEIPFDFHELIGALAPRCVFINAPTGDGNFKADSVDRIAKAARPIFKLYGHDNRLRVEHPKCGHDFPPELRQVAYEFIDECFGIKRK
jgi:dipeptidyl aminopeptidase/acylaminoacyl peptidase